MVPASFSPTADRAHRPGPPDRRRPGLWACPGFLTWEGLAREQATLRAGIAAHALLAPILFVLIYIGSVTLSLPQAGLLTLSGGLLFGTAVGGSLAAVGATIGAVLLFLIARSAFGESMAKRGGASVTKLRDGLRRDGFSYLLAIRLVPIFPFWLVNLGGRAVRHATAPLRPRHADRYPADNLHYGVDRRGGSAAY